MGKLAVYGGIEMWVLSTYHWGKNESASRWASESAQVWEII